MYNTVFTHLIIQNLISFTVFTEANKIPPISACITFPTNEVIFVYVGSGIRNSLSLCTFTFCLPDET